MVKAGSTAVGEAVLTRLNGLARLNEMKRNRFAHLTMLEATHWEFSATCLNAPEAFACSLIS